MCGLSAPPTQGRDTQFCIFSSFLRSIFAVSSRLLFLKRFFWHVLIGTGVWGESQLKEEAKQSQSSTMSSVRGNSAKLPFAIVCSQDKEEKRALRQALSSLSKALFFNDSSAFRCKAPRYRRGKLPFVLLMAQIYLGHLLNSALRRESTKGGFADAPRLGLYN